ncbi:hypothetical protein AZI86_15215 [Bdellovibrio bacteriovorus]|uniref:Uncharacterized protein n=1 Tax=Bdellovibrio bacteriovorus TaxID=959 RepID=A0A150WHP7_BDEBC|nr:hypothetical protein [Bdellovibrio bacteriovorus]KYG63067.1 hypothetical protein AZI86_15215 [Bdellovibrio bacteriovorus]
MARIRTSSGFTITELLVATGLASAFFLIGASVIQQLFQFQKDVNTRLMDSFSITNFHRSLNQDLEGSYWHRFGAFSCASSNRLMETMGTSEVNLNSSGGFLEFVTADYSSTIGNVPNTTELTVASMRNLDVGNYVLLSLAADPSVVSLFRVRSVARDTGRINLDTTSLSVAGSNCNFALPSRPLTDFFGASASSNALLTRIKIVQYRITGGSLTRTALPGGSAEELMDKMNSMNVRSTWAASADGTAAKIFGQMKFQVVLDHNQSTLMGSKQTSRKQENVTAQYALNSFQYLNRNFTSGSAPITATFPSCSVGVNFRPGSLKVSSAHYSDTVPVSLAGYVSTDKVKGATIDVNFSPRTGAQIDCFKYDPDSSDLPYQVTGIGMSQTISLAQTATGFDIYTCAVKGIVDVVAAMTYFATDINQTKTIPCSVESIEAPTRYIFIGAAPKCDRELASYDMGSEMYNTISTGSTVSIGKFGVDMDSSCQWQGQADASATGLADNCDWGSHAGLELRRIYLRPYKQQVYAADKVTPLFSSQGAYINCD